MSISKQTPTDSLGDPSKYIRTKSGETFVSLLNLNKERTRSFEVDNANGASFGERADD